MPIVLESAEARASCQTGSTLLLPIVLGCVTCKCTFFIFGCESVYKLSPTSLSAFDRTNVTAPYTTPPRQHIKDGEVCCQKHVISTILILYYVHACMLAAVAMHSIHCLVLVLLSPTTYTHAGKEEELLQRQSTATFLFWALFMYLHASYGN